MKTKSVLLLLLSVLFVVGMASCDDDDPEVVAEETVVEEPAEAETEESVDEELPAEETVEEEDEDLPLEAITFAKGADVSWVTEMEADGITFYNSAGEATECITLLKSLGFNAIRLRVWVDPADGYCGKDDVVAKAIRARKLGMHVMVDFHYSDSWADPEKQIKPTAWQGLSLTDLKAAITSHTTDILQALKDEGITPDWVQIGNEIRSGILWDSDATLSGATWEPITYGGSTYYMNQQNFCDFLTTGYEAAKSIFPETLVIAHCDNGDDVTHGYLNWVFGDILERYGAKYDVIGLSLYPTAAWTTPVSNCVSNIRSLIQTYGKPVMLCEVGMPQEPADTAKACLTELLASLTAIDNCLGIFYWEPECFSEWNGYGMGAFNNDGTPTTALDAFTD